MQDGDFLGGLIGNTNLRSRIGVSTNEELAMECKTHADNAVRMVDAQAMQASQYALQAATLAGRVGVVTPTYNEVQSVATALMTDYNDDNRLTAKTITDFRTVLNNLSANCYSMQHGVVESETASKIKRENRKRSLINLGGAAVTGVAGTLIVNRLTKDIQDAELDAAKKEAYTEFMETIGKHIHCYIGADEAGTFGDIITTSME